MAGPGELLQRERPRRGLSPVHWFTRGGPASCESGLLRGRLGCGPGPAAVGVR